jgi:hypothetical protein
MNRLQAVLCVLLLSSLQYVAAQLIAYEGFDLAQGEDALGGTSGGATSTGWSGVWTSTTVDVVSGLTYETLTTVDGAALLDTPNSGAFRGFATTFNTGTVWLSFISVVSNASSYAGVSLLNNFGNERLFVGDPQGASNWGFQATGLSTVMASSVSATNISFLVVRIDWNAGVTNNDNIYMWVNPSFGTEPSTSSPSASELGININPAGNGEFINRVRMQQGGATNNAVIDEIRIGRTWADVAPTSGGGPEIVPTDITFISVLAGNQISINISNLTIGATNELQRSYHLLSGAWETSTTFIASGLVSNVTDAVIPGSNSVMYRVISY